MEISPISGALGAEISGIDISKKLTNTETQLLQENFLKFKVLFFRNQNLSAQTFVSFAKHFAVLDSNISGKPFAALKTAR